MLRRLLLPALLAVLGCSADTGPEGLSMTGNWRQSGDVRDAGTGDTLIYLGEYRLVQSGDAFSGSGEQGPVCSASLTSHESPLANPAAFAVSEGRLVGRTLSFKRDICDYQGSFEGSSNKRITGTATCRYSANGIDYLFSGQWQADKLD